MKTNIVAFGGNGQFCTLLGLTSIEKDSSYAWTDSLVEDFDLSLRVHLALPKNYLIVKNSNIYITQTGIVDNEKALIKQRTWWAQGNV